MFPHGNRPRDGRQPRQNRLVLNDACAMQQARSSNFMGSPVEPRHEVEHQIEHRLAINARRAALSRAVVDVGLLALGFRDHSIRNNMSG
jgi:hypothetical protein